MTNKAHNKYSFKRKNSRSGRDSRFGSFSGNNYFYIAFDQSFSGKHSRAQSSSNEEFWSNTGRH